MKTLFAVVISRGPAWDANKPMRSQEQWDEHARFMDGLAARGFVVLGGPLSESNDVLLVINAADKDEITSTLTPDPWHKSGMLYVKEVQTWTILLESNG